VSSALEILSELDRRGVSVTLDGDALVLKPRRALDDALLARLREAKPAILRALRQRPATCSPDCYEVESGRWIHHPWNGCTTIRPETGEPLRKVQEKCWHCGGERICDCIACWQGGPSKCATCKGTGKVPCWVQ